MVNDRHPGPQGSSPGTPADADRSPAAGEFGELTMVSAQGAPMRVKARFGADLPRMVRPPAVGRRVQLTDDRSGLQVRLPETELGNDAAQTGMEAEIAAALTLHRAYSGTRYSGLFPVPVGHDVNAAEPFIVYAAPRGSSVAALAQGVSTSQQRVIERDLVLAVRLMEAVGLVHQGIVPAAVRWDEHGIQLWDLGSVTRLGLPRRPCGIPPYASPEQRAGEGLTDARDALWSVGQVMHQLVTGRPGHPDGPSADLTAHPSLAQTLAPVFAPRAADRPLPGQLLHVLMPGAGADVPAAGKPDPLDPYRRDFDTALRRKRASLRRTPPPPVVPPPQEPPWHASAPETADDRSTGPTGSSGPDGPLGPLGPLGPADPSASAASAADDSTWFYGGSTTAQDPETAGTERGGYR
ncbi:hypothetical protein U5640_35620 [Streptomyces sp. SS7]|uniref:hypothetical protein n=1 Tax=Streptomyces sp. SS7 TaxID=3108485 RepID=UPI0030EEF797